MEFSTPFFDILKKEYYYWRTQDHKKEVDFILYGEKGLIAIEVKLARKIRDEDYRSLMTFVKDYPQAKALLLYTGQKSYVFNDIQVIPVENFLKNKAQFL